MTIQKIAIGMSKNCQKLGHFFQKNCYWQFSGGSYVDVTDSRVLVTGIVFSHTPNFNYHLSNNVFLFK